MSLVSTLAKVAIGIAVSKGLKNMVGGGSTSRSSGGGLGDLLGGALGGGTSGRSSGGGLGDILEQLGGGSSRSGGGLGDLLGGALGGAAGKSSGGSSGGIGDLLGAVLGSGGSSRNGGTGLEDLMGSVLKGNSGNTNGGLGDILGKLGGGSAGGGIGDLLTNALENKGQVTQKTTQADEDAAGLIIRAMIQAAKADGTIDESEKEQLVGQLGNLSQEEVQFINGEMNRQIDVNGLARDVPNGMEGQVYMMSLMGIKLDTQGEASYLNDLAQSMNLGRDQVNQIHSMVGVEPLYR